ncbi:MAG: hypothetical protein EPN61_18120 [Burkholderiaceae bacterium]|nr:MAG: hypothetical protein EPN61_18120 [Burkholderiaceae bacterium]
MAVTEEALRGVLDGLVESGNAELRDMSQAGLESYWFFRWDDKHSLEQNIYEFHDMLELYGSWCRRWEEMHRGSCCVVERVRDTYLMPKIRELAARIRGTV